MTDERAFLLPSADVFAARDGATLLHGNALDLPLADESVDLIVTSPPYFALRSYTDGGEHYDGQIGSEATPQEFLEALWAATAEMVRVLKPSGSIWVNLGDKYAAGHGGSSTEGKGITVRKRSSFDAAPKERTDLQNPPASWGKREATGRNVVPGFRPKTLMGMPWRYAIGCIDDLDLILRAEVVWCLSGGARVYAEIGGKPRPIMLRDLVRAYRPENVRLWNGEKWTQVLGWNLSADTEGALELELRSGERIGCTPGHQWPTERGLLRADEIEVGDVIDSCQVPDVDEHSAIGRDLGWFVGLYIAEGSRSGQTIQFAGHADETERLERLERLASLYDGSCHGYTDGNKANITVSGAILRGVLDRYVSPGTAKTKRLTMHAWGRGNDFLLGVIEGYLSGDGHWDEVNQRWRLGFTDNDEWAADLRTLAARLGASLTLKRTTVTGFGQEWPAWRGEWRSAFRSAGLARNRSEVVAIRRSRARQFFDVGVADEPHLFALASGVLTHNSKPNGLPESVTDRVRRSHEQWFHFTKEPRYYAAVDEVREPQVRPHDPPRPMGVRNKTPRHTEAADYTGWKDHSVSCHPLGKLPGSVWSIPSEPLRVPESLGVDHFAAFPQEWPRRIILGWSPPGVCVECGEGRRPVVAKEKDVYYGEGEFRSGAQQVKDGAAEVGWKQDEKWRTTATITGYACACDDPTAPTRPAVVLDPFGGTGTTAMVARALGRHGVSLDLSLDYLRLAEWRVWESGHSSKTRERTNREAQGGLFDE